MLVTQYIRGKQPNLTISRPQLKLTISRYFGVSETCGRCRAHAQQLLLAAGLGAKTMCLRMYRKEGHLRTEPRTTSCGWQICCRVVTAQNLRFSALHHPESINLLGLVEVSYRFEEMRRSGSIRLGSKSPPIQTYNIRYETET